MQGRILSCSAGVYRVLTSEKIYNCSARGAFRQEGVVLVAGDVVEVVPDEKDFDSAVITELLPRRNNLIRPGVSNVDILFIVFAIHDPEPSFYSIDKLSAIAEHNNIRTHIIFNKCDLATPSEIEELSEIYKKCGYTVHTLSAGISPEQIRQTLFEYTKDNTCVFTGPSGVGKSTIINALYPDLELETGVISQKNRRGKNTTRTTTLYKTRENDGTYFVDTPGFTLLDFDRFRFMKKEELVYSFREYADLAPFCRYTKCTHTKEEGCKILEKIADGTLPRSRHASFLALFEILKNHKDWENK
jgi:ribosome biogenesis GTPase